MRSYAVSATWLFVLALSGGPLPAQKKGEADLWLTTPDQKALFQRQTTRLRFSRTTNRNPVIEVDESSKFQTIDGFGYALTGGSAQHLIRMDAGKRAALLRELFGTAGTSLGVSYLRLSIGASDLNDHVFSYDDLASGESDAEMARFSLEPDRADVIPVLHEILAIDRHIRILASPWSAPAWMKTNHHVKGGQLKPECYAAYARYFVKYIQGMRAEHIRIDAITIQNEPLNDKNTPSMVMQAEEQADFIKNHLGPALRRAGLDTRIVLYDHNCDVPQYATTILDDAAAAKYVDGSGFHLYRGKIEAMTTVHDAHPGKNLYFTEQMVTGSIGTRPTVNVGAQVQRLILGATRNWSRNVILWNLAADPKNNPHTDNGGCSMCQGAITIDGNEVSRNVAYYVVAHASKFVRPGSVRIASSTPDGLANVAFRTPGGRKVLIVVNSSAGPQDFNIRYRGGQVTTMLAAGAAGTYVW